VNVKCEKYKSYTICLKAEVKNAFVCISMLPTHFTITSTVTRPWAGGLCACGLILPGMKSFLISKVSIPPVGPTQTPICGY
jgi:hypothetical protein